MECRLAIHRQRLLPVVVLLILGVLQVSGAAPRLSFGGTQNQPVEIEPENSSGLDAVFVAETVTGLTVTYRASNAALASALTWERYGAAGGGYAEPVPEADLVRSGSNVTLRNPRGATGYLITDGTTRCYFWLADYSATPFLPRSFEPGEADCSTLEMRFEGEASRMTYYSINGRQLEIDRGITVSYDTQIFDRESGRFVTTTVSDNRAWIDELLMIQAPLTATSVTVDGDRFLEQWGRRLSVTSATVQPVAIDASTEAVQTERDNANEQKIDGVELGGSAPAEITFTAAVTDAAIFTEWQIAADPEFDLIDYRSNDLEMEYTFRDMGTLYVRFVAANADATCEWYSDTYTVSVGESSLICPNAFSPGESEGVNDEWKVSYKSIVSFECHIFNKWGVKMAEFHDPSQGWDGRYDGKVVPAGVYYYVIKAVGADGRKYDRAGDINIVNYR
ncbi:MAG: gliding motility-associated C-terminal domain-containing protein [Clostridium sp.]|nr:gliding motility-associated C-terminal domain-containing protein [Clostridium sp.]